MKKNLFTVILSVMLAVGWFALPAFAAQELTAGAPGETNAQLTTTASAKHVAIKPISLSKARIAVSSQLYTGKALRPKVKVKLGTKTLVKGRHYTLTYKNNVKPGKATVHVKGIKAYKGTAKATFSIKTKKGLMKVGSSAYFFKNTKGTLAKGWARNGLNRYWAAPNGKLAKGWKSISGSWFYFDSTRYAAKTGWQKIGSSWYYFDGRTCAAKTGWQKINGKWYFFDKSTCAAKTGWQEIDGKWYYFDKGSCAALTGWREIDGKWYFFDEESCAAKTGWQELGGNWFFFYENCSMAAATWVGDYYLQDNGVMATNTWIGDYWVDGSGRWTETASSSDSSEDSSTVYVTTSGYGKKYHRGSCSTIKNSHVKALSVSEALDSGYTACRVCKP